MNERMIDGPRPIRGLPRPNDRYQAKYVTPHAAVLDLDAQSAQGNRVKRRDIIAILTHMFYLYGVGLGSADLPREELAEFFGVSRATIFRALADVKRTQAETVDIARRLLPSESLEKEDAT